MSYILFEPDDPFNPSTLSNLDEKSQYQVFDDQQEREKEYSSFDSIQKQNVQNKNHQEAKNIPKNMGVLIKNYFIKNYKDLVRQNIAIKKFITKVNNKKNYTRKDLKVLFSNEQARQICKEYFSSFQIIMDILKSTKISDSEVILKYVKKLFIGTQNPQSLSSLKYTKQEF